MRPVRVTQSRLDAYRAQVDAYGDAAAVYVEEYVRALMAESPDLTVAQVRDEAIEAIDEALSAFGDQASDLALDLFEEIVIDGYGLSPDTAIEDVIPREMVEGGVRYSARRLVEGESDAFVRDVADLSRYYVHRSAFENMERNCWRNDLRYARIPSGRETCAFCFMLSSRGFVYRSEETAGSTQAYHEHCDCAIVPGFEGIPASEQVEGYDPDGMRERWRACKATVGTDGELRERWESMDDRQRSQYKGNNDYERYQCFVNAQVRHEVETRDWRWLYTGEVPRVTFESAELEAEVRKKRPQEIVTAHRLADFGIAPDFISDSVEFTDQRTGLVQRVGLADFANGYEIKTLETASSYNTINGYLKNTSKKRNARCVCFDNSSGAIDDETLIGYLLRSRSFRRGRVYVIASDGSYRLIR